MRRLLPSFGSAHLSTAVALAAVLCAVWVSSLGARQWTDRSGEYRVEAELVGFQDGVVTLRKTDGTEVQVALDTLSEADGRFVRGTVGRSGGPAVRGDMTNARTDGQAIDASRWAVLVGVDKYDHIKPDLTYCGADVRALGEQLIAAGFGRQRVVVLHDQAARNLLPSKANIERQLLLTLESVGPGDFVFVAFSGHGVRLDGRSYLCPYDGKMEPSELLAVSAIYTQLQDSAAKFKLFLVDACQDDKTPPKEIVPTRSGGAVKSFGTDEKLPEGILLMTSCSAGQKAVEEPKFGHGVFTHFLLEGLAGKADADGSESVSLLEWAGYASSRTRAYVRSLDRAQSPSLKGEFPDFELASIPRTEPVRPLVKPPTQPPMQPKPPSGVTAEREITNSLGMKLKLIPAGEFQMGSPESEENRWSDEGPQHRVRITRPFYLGVYEVTQSEYEAVMGSNPSKFKGARLPVETVSWEEAMDFCRKLSATEGVEYRLPTEAEWEYACRAGTTTPFSFGSSLNGDQANCDGNYPYGTLTKGAYKKQTVTVGSYAANAFGLYDLHGNVWEWCSDWYDGKYYAGSPVDDPTGPTGGSRRVCRGGSWDGDARGCRAANRDRYVPSYRYGSLGFRLARTVSSPSR
ncbi:SUMF1/EgtB/PvdO family nonheme iron enzyme [bacterium]|nr:SUMF1/EgtB/PvdO family nonheme iron enzyme [bacterium]